MNTNEERSEASLSNLLNGVLKRIEEVQAHVSLLAKPDNEGNVKQDKIEDLFREVRVSIDGIVLNLDRNAIDIKSLHHALDRIRSDPFEFERVAEVIQRSIDDRLNIIQEYIDSANRDKQLLNDGDVVSRAVSDFSRQLLIDLTSISETTDRDLSSSESLSLEHIQTPMQKNSTNIHRIKEEFASSQSQLSTLIEDINLTLEPSFNILRGKRSKDAGKMLSSLKSNIQSISEGSHFHKLYDAITSAEASNESTKDAISALERKISANIHPQIASYSDRGTIEDEFHTHMEHPNPVAWPSTFTSDSDDISGKSELNDATIALSDIRSEHTTLPSNYEDSVLTSSEIDRPNPTALPNWPRDDTTSIGEDSTLELAKKLSNRKDETYS